VITASASLADLSAHGAGELRPYLGRPRPPETTVEWLGIAVSRLPDLGARARTADEIHNRGGRMRRLHMPLMEALTDGIAAAGSFLSRALDCHLARHAASSEHSNIEEDVESYAALLVRAHRSAGRRAEFLIGGYASFLAGAIEAAGALGEAELSVARARRWDRANPERLVAQHASAVYSALVNALGGLLAYARLTAEDSDYPAEDDS
jgi:hypothetical protein